MLLAIDGPAASGKGTLGRLIAAHYGLAHLDTGKLYRAVARDVLVKGASPGDVKAALSAAEALDFASLDDPALMDGRLGEAASLVAALPEVRAVLVTYQRAFARRSTGAVLDGRDIGTVICPDADVKLFVTASAFVRAGRRYRELVVAGLDIAEAEVLADIRRRDQRDENRAVSPLRRPEDAYLLDTTNLDIDAAFKAAIALIDAAMGHAGQAG
jgi:cytidylate kinase